MPQPTVATPTTPIVQRTTKPEQKAWYTPIDATDIEQMDLKQLRDFQRSIEFDMRMGIKPDKETYLKLQRASDRATELSAPQQQATTTALDQLITQQEAARQAEQQTLEAQNQAQLEAQRAFEAERMAAIQAANEKAAEKQRNTLGYILWAQWAATSSFGAEKINEITQYYNQQNQLAMAESNAALEKFKAQQEWATREQLDRYDQQIFSLQNTRANFQLAAAQKMDEYNQAQALWTAQSLQNIMDVALAQEQAAIPLTDAELELVRSYWQLAIDDKGNLDRQFLESIDPRLRNSVIVAAAAVKWAIPKEPKTLNTEGGAYVYDYATQTWKKLAWSQKEKEDNRKDMGDGTILNTRTGETKAITWTGTIESAIQSAVDTVWDAAQCGRFVNEVWRQAGVNLWIGNSYQSKVQAVDKIWRATNINEMWAGSIFAYPTNVELTINWEKVRPWHIGIITGVNPDGTVNLMDYNYNKDEKRREVMNVDPNEIISLWWVISKPIITNQTVQPSQDLVMRAQWLVQWLWGTEKERQTLANNIVKKAQSDNISLQQAKKELGYKTWDDVEFAKTRKEQVQSITKNDESIRKAKQALALLDKPTTAIWDVATIVWFLKAIDPNSVARESEVASVENARWLADTISAQYQKLKTWDKLSPTQRNELRQVITTIVNAYDANLVDTISSLKQEFEQRWLDMSVYIPKNVISKYAPTAEELAKRAASMATAWQTQTDDPLWLFQ